MSGAEAIAVLGVISSIISIVDGTKQVYDAATDVNGLPEAFREVASRLPIITGILSIAERYVKEGSVSADSYKGVNVVIQACQDKATKLEVLFRKVIPGENASRRERYLSAVKTIGKGNTVEKLMKGMLEDLQLLVGEHNIRVATTNEVEQVAKAIRDVSALPPSIPENELQEPSFTANYSGSGTQYNAQGEYIAQGNARQYNSGGGPMYFDQRTVYTQAATDRRETPPVPTSSVPFSHDPDYVDRQGLLERVSAKCSIPASRTALVGLGGVGKSQVAIEISYHVRDQSPDTWVFWVHASNAARVEQSYREITDRVKIPSRKDPKANVYNLVYNWLYDRTKGKWFLILDNVDDYRVLNEDLLVGQDGQGSNRRPLSSYLPQSDNGSVIITTRSMEVALRLVEQSNTIEVRPMEESHAITLFEKKLGKQSEDKDVAELVRALEFMPLAIVQAAVYILQRVLRCSVQQYLEEFRKSDRKKTSLLNHEAGHLRRDWEAKNSIITTWQISFDHICQVRASAADLLSLMSFFDRQGIPEMLIRCRDLQQNHRKLEGSDVDTGEESEDNTLESTVNDGFEEDVQTLKSYSFISVNADCITFEMHGLVQLATQAWLVSHVRLKRWKWQFIKNLDFEFPTGEYKNWERCESFFPHAKSALAQRPDEKDTLRQWASLLGRAAQYALERGNTSDAGNIAGQVVEAMSNHFGKDHLHTLKGTANLALIYIHQGQWDKAEKLEVKVIETLKSKLGSDHPDTLGSMANLASVYRNQGRWDEAEKLDVEVLKTRKTKLGVDHPDTLGSMSNLAATYSNQGRWDEAEKLNVKVIETHETKLGADHPRTLTSIANLASTYRNQGRWDEAEKLQVEVMETSKTKLGVDHLHTLSSMNNLAFTWKARGQDHKALELMEDCVQLQTRVLGINHPDTNSSSAALGQWKSSRASRRLK